MIRGPDFKRREWLHGWQNPVGRLRQTLQGRLGLPHIYSFAQLAAQKRTSREKQSRPILVLSTHGIIRRGQDGMA